jgi:hypothetical protein
MTATGVVQTGVVGLPADLDVPYAETVIIERDAQLPEGSDIFQVQYAGQRGLYANGFACGRSRDPVGDQVAFRCQCHSSDNGTTQVIFSAADAGNNDQFITRANGDSEITRDLAVGRNVIFTGPTTDKTLEPVTDWTAPTGYGTGIAGNVGTPWFDVGSRVEAWGRCFLRGRVITTAGVSYVANAEILTLAVGHRPAADVLYSIRTQGTGAGNGTITITSAGVLSFSANISLTGGQTATVQLDGISFPTSLT